MKPVSLAIPPQDARKGGAARFEKDRVLQRALDELYFVIPIEPGVGATFAGITVDTATWSFTTFDMPAGAITAYRRSARMRDLWPKTTARLNLWFTSPIGSTANFAIRWVGKQSGAGFVLGTPAAVFTHDFTLAGPAVANAIIKATYKASVPLLSSPELFAFTFARLGGTAPDVNVNALRIVYGDVTLEESA